MHFLFVSMLVSMARLEGSSQFVNRSKSRYHVIALSSFLLFASPPDSAGKEIGILPRLPGWNFALDYHFSRVPQFFVVTQCWMTSTQCNKWVPIDRKLPSICTWQIPSICISPLQHVLIFLRSKQTPKSLSNRWKGSLKTTNVSLFSSRKSKNLTSSCDRGKSEPF